MYVNANQEDLITKRQYFCTFRATVTAIDTCLDEREEFKGRDST